MAASVWNTWLRTASKSCSKKYHIRLRQFYQNIIFMVSIPVSDVKISASISAVPRFCIVFLSFLMLGSGSWCPRVYRSLQAYCTTRNLRRSNLHHQFLHVTMTPATLAVKGGTIGREMAGKFGKSATWDRTAFTSPSEGRCAEDFFRSEKSDGFGRVWTRELGYQRPARYL
jgi:hypothetical protein